MTQINAVIITKKQNMGYKVRFTSNLKTRLLKLTNKKVYERIEFVELPHSMTKLDGLKYVANSSLMNVAEIQQVLLLKIAYYSNKDVRHKYKLAVTNNISAEDLLLAIDYRV